MKKLMCVLESVGAASLVLAVGILMTGCVSVGYNTETGDVRYFRFGSQKIAGVTITLVDGTQIRIDSADSDAAVFAEKMINLGISIATKAAVR